MPARTGRAARRRRRWLPGYALGAALAASTALGAGLRDVADGWLLAPGQTVALLQGAGGPTGEAVATPATGAWVQAGQMRLFGTPDLPVLAAGAGAAGRRGRWGWFLAGQWQRTGNGLVVEELGGLRLGVGTRWRLGWRLDWSRLDLGGRREGAALASALEIAAPLALRPGWRLELEALLPTGPPPAWFGPGGRRQRLRAVLSDLRRRLALAAAVDQRGDGTPCLGLDLLAALGPTCAAGLRADPATGALGPVTVWRLPGLLVRTSHVIHPDLGPTHRFELTAGRPGAAR